MKIYIHQMILLLIVRGIGVYTYIHTYMDTLKNLVLSDHSGSTLRFMVMVAMATLIMVAIGICSR